jgi:hypothetical protein
MTGRVLLIPGSSSSKRTRLLIKFMRFAALQAIHSRRVCSGTDTAELLHCSELATLVRYSTFCITSSITRLNLKVGSRSQRSSPLSSRRNNAEKLSNQPDRLVDLIQTKMFLSGLVALSHKESSSEVLMRRDELMKPDVFSEVLLLIVGTLMLMLLGSTAWLAIVKP